MILPGEQLRRYGILWRWKKRFPEGREFEWQTLVGTFKENNEVTPLTFQREMDARIFVDLVGNANAEYQVVSTVFSAGSVVRGG